jgi:hypothetical protein
LWFGLPITVCYVARVVPGLRVLAFLPGSPPFGLLFLVRWVLVLLFGMNLHYLADIAPFRFCRAPFCPVCADTGTVSFTVPPHHCRLQRLQTCCRYVRVRSSSCVSLDTWFFVLFGLVLLGSSVLVLFGLVSCTFGWFGLFGLVLKLSCLFILFPAGWVRLGCWFGFTPVLFPPGMVDYRCWFTVRCCTLRFCCLFIITIFHVRAWLWRKGGVHRCFSGKPVTGGKP